VTVLEADITDPALRPTLPAVAHAFANPPYWPAGTIPPESIRANATHAEGTPPSTGASTVTPNGAKKNAPTHASNPAAVRTRPRQNPKMTDVTAISTTSQSQAVNWLRSTIVRSRRNHRRTHPPGLQRIVGPLSSRAIGVRPGPNPD